MRLTTDSVSNLASIPGTQLKNACHLMLPVRIKSCIRVRQATLTVAFTRSSKADSQLARVPPMLMPVTPMRSGSISGRVVR